MLDRCLMNGDEGHVEDAGRYWAQSLKPYIEQSLKFYKEKLIMANKYQREDIKVGSRWQCKFNGTIHKVESIFNGVVAHRLNGNPACAVVFSYDFNFIKDFIKLDDKVSIPPKMDLGCDHKWVTYTPLIGKTHYVCDKCPTIKDKA